MIVPLFALANAGIEISKEFLVRSATSPIAHRIIAGYVLASRSASLAPVVVRHNSGATTNPSGLGGTGGDRRHRRHRFTVSLLIASLAFSGPGTTAKLGIPSWRLCSPSLIAWMIFGLTGRLSPAHTDSRCSARPRR